MSTQAAALVELETETQPRLGLEVAAELSGAKKRDCRECKAFRPNPEGLGFGWCEAFNKFVKLYHPQGEFFSQCQFEKLTRCAE